MKPLTAKIYLFIRTHCHTQGVAPSRREIMAEFGVSSGGVNYHIDKLIEAGAVTQEKYKARTLRPVRTPRKQRHVSLEKQAAAWAEQGGLCIWQQDADGGYSSVQLVDAGRGVVAEVKLVEVT